MSNYCQKGHWEEGMKLPCKQCQIDELRAEVARLTAENERLSALTSQWNADQAPAATDGDVMLFEAEAKRSRP